MPAGVGLPANAHAVTGVQSQYGAPSYRDFADNLVAGDQRILADAPVIVDHVEIAAAYSAMGDGDFHLVRLEVPGVVLVGQKFGASGMRGESLNQRHKSVALGSGIEYKGPRKSGFTVEEDRSNKHLSRTENHSS